MEDLRIGAAMLKETIDMETQKQGRMQRSKEEGKVAAAAVAQNVCSFRLSLEFNGWAHTPYQVKLAFLDDRKTKALRDERERLIREARKANRDTAVVSDRTGEGSSSDVVMPGVGHSLVSSHPEIVDQADLEEED